MYIISSNNPCPLSLVVQLNWTLSRMEEFYLFQNLGRFMKVLMFIFICVFMFAFMFMFIFVYMFMFMISRISSFTCSRLCSCLSSFTCSCSWSLEYFRFNLLKLYPMINFHCWFNAWKNCKDKTSANISHFYI